MPSHAQWPESTRPFPPSSVPNGYHRTSTSRFPVFFLFVFFHHVQPMEYSVPLGKKPHPGVTVGPSRGGLHPTPQISVSSTFTSPNRLSPLADVFLEYRPLAYIDVEMKP